LQEEALEGINYIRQSAHQVPSAAGILHCCGIPVSQCHCLWSQAFLETEPGFRSTTEEYMMRYQTFARDELVKALDKHQALLKSVGKDDKAGTTTMTHF